MVRFESYVNSAGSEAIIGSQTGHGLFESYVNSAGSEAHADGDTVDQ